MPIPWPVFFKAMREMVDYTSELHWRRARALDAKHPSSDPEVKITHEVDATYLVSQPWTCPRCYRIWSPQTPECAHCNDPDTLKAWLKETCELQARMMEEQDKARKVFDASIPSGAFREECS
jgi:hypothetical protein